jgi:hypothetical protein
MHKHNDRLRKPDRGNGGLLYAVLAIMALELCADQRAFLPLAKAQTAALGIVTASELVLTPGMDTPWDISVTNTNKEALPDQTVLLVRGLTPEMRISEGRAFGTGVWVIPLAGIAKLKISVPANARKGAILDVSLATLEGKTLAQRRLTAVIAPAEVPTSTQSTATTPAPAPLAPLSPKERETALLLVQKGDEHMKLGNPLNARQFYQRATERGLPEAAMALGATYDPVELAQYQGIVTVQPDVNLARKWYEKASELGDRSAAARIQRLSQR